MQKGFTLTATQVALISVILITSATLYSLDKARQQANDSKAHVNASYLLKVGEDIKWAVNRAIIDNNRNISQAQYIIVFDEITSDKQINIFDQKHGYMSKPALPKELLVEDIDMGKLYWDDQYGNILTMHGINIDVCRRFNELLQGTDYSEKPPVTLEFAYKYHGWQQGCYAEYESEYGIWFMNVTAIKQCLGTECKTMDIEGSVVREIKVDIEFIRQQEEKIMSVLDEPVKTEIMKLTDCVDNLISNGDTDPTQIGLKCREQIEIIY